MLVKRSGVKLQAVLTAINCACVLCMHLSVHEQCIHYRPTGPLTTAKQVQLRVCATCCLCCCAVCAWRRKGLTALLAVETSEEAARAFPLDERRTALSVLHQAITPTAFWRRPSDASPHRRHQHTTALCLCVSTPPTPPPATNTCCCTYLVGAWGCHRRCWSCGA